MKPMYALAVGTLIIGCSSTPAPRASNTVAATPASSGHGTVEPDRAKAVGHFKEHVKYPASRSDILAACAQTPEFSGAEKDWMAQHLPEGTYKSPDEVIAALRL